jgi:hypothetical protein
MSEFDKMVGVVLPFQIGTRRKEICPVKLKDWPAFGKCVSIFDLEALQDIHRYADGPETLIQALKIVTNCGMDDPLDPLFDDMTQADYKKLREMIICQNELDFEYLHKVEEQKNSKKENPLP